MPCGRDTDYRFPDSQKVEVDPKLNWKGNLNIDGGVLNQSPVLLSVLNYSKNIKKIA